MIDHDLRRLGGLGLTEGRSGDAAAAAPPSKDTTSRRRMRLMSMTKPLFQIPETTLGVGHGSGNTEGRGASTGGQPAISLEPSPRGPEYVKIARSSAGADRRNGATVAAVSMLSPQRSRAVGSARNKTNFCVPWQGYEITATGNKAFSQPRRQ